MVPRSGADAHFIAGEQAVHVLYGSNDAVNLCLPLPHLNHNHAHWTAAQTSCSMPCKPTNTACQSGVVTGTLFSLSLHAHLFQSGHDQAHVVQVNHLPVQAGHSVPHVLLERLQGSPAPLYSGCQQRASTVRAAHSNLACKEHCSDEATAGSNKRSAASSSGCTRSMGGEEDPRWEGCCPPGGPRRPWRAGSWRTEPSRRPPPP